MLGKGESRVPDITVPVYATSLEKFHKFVAIAKESFAGYRGCSGPPCPGQEELCQRSCFQVNTATIETMIHL